MRNQSTELMLFSETCSTNGHFFSTNGKNILFLSNNPLIYDYLHLV